MLTGLHAAVLTPRLADGSLHLKGLEHHLLFLLDRGIHQLAVNGATGEFCRTTRAEAETIFEVTASVSKDRASFIAGIGTSSEATTIELGNIAERFGATAVLLPMPYFFRYSQGDLAATCRTVAERLSLPVLLYNLPQFSTGIAPETALSLIRQCPNIIGIKDSGGSLDCMRLLSAEKISSGRIIGNDGALQSALIEHVCDGVISGVASVLPELLGAIYEKRFRPEDDFMRLYAQLNNVVTELERLPAPWGLKVAAEMRGVGGPAALPFSLSSSRANNIFALQDWFRINQHRLLIT